VSRSDRERLTDMLDALDRCVRFSSHLHADEAAIADMAFDAIPRNLTVVGEAAKALPDETRKLFEAVPWHSIAGLRNAVVHEYFRIEAEVIRDIVETEVAPLAEAVRDHLASTASPDDA